MTREIITDLGPRRVLGDPRPERRAKASPAEWKRLREEKLVGRSCRICVALLADSLHHLVPRSQSGDDVADNLVGLCGDGTRGCHGRVEARDPWACSLLGRRLTAEERAYVTAKKGAWYLEKRYGLREVAA